MGVGGPRSRRMAGIVRTACSLVVCGLLLVMSVQALAQPTALSGADCDPDQVTIGPDGWESIAAPEFSSGPPVITSYGVFATRPDVLLVSNGSAIARSEDGGCTFSEVWKVPSLELSAGARVWQLVPSETGAERAYAIIVNAPLGAPQIYVSSDGGTSWSGAGRGLPVGDIIDLALAPSDPDVAYALTNTAEGFTREVFVTTDAGATWQARGHAVGELLDRLQGVAARLIDLEVDDLEHETVWAGSSRGLLLSTDAAATFEPVRAKRSVPGVTHGPIVKVDVHHLPGRPARILAYDDIEHDYRSVDGGATFVRGNLPGPFRSMAADSANLILSVDKGFPSVFLYAPGTYTGWLMAAGVRPPFEDLSATTAGTFYALSDSKVVRGRAAPLSVERAKELYGADVVRPGIPRKPCSQFEPPPPIQPGVSSAGPPRLTPNHSEIQLVPGQEVTVPYALHLPSRPIDLLFLIDTAGGQMGHQLCSVRKLLVGSMGALYEGGYRNVHAGVSEFRAYFGEEFVPGGGEKPPGLPWGWKSNTPSDHLFRKVRDVGPVGQDLDGVLRDLDGAGGPGANLLGLHEVATGSGHQVSEPQMYVSPGQATNFRPWAVKTIVHITNSWAHLEERMDFGPPRSTNVLPPEAYEWKGPSFQDAIRALKEAGIYQIGIQMARSFKQAGTTSGRGLLPAYECEQHRDPCTNARYSPYEDLARVARATGAVATKPVACVDHEEEARHDVDAGFPLVCGFSGSWVAIRNMLEAMPYDRAGDVTLTPSDQPRLLGEISPNLHPDVDLTIPTDRNFEVTFACEGADAGLTETIDLSARVDGIEIAEAEVDVSCSALPPPVAFPPVVTGVLMLPPPPPVTQPITSPVQAPAQAPASQPAPAKASNPQPAAVAQRQAQPQAAFVAAMNKVQEKLATQNMMVRARTGRRSGYPTHALHVAGALVLMTMWSLSSAGARVLARVHTRGTRRR